ncbi:MAG: carbon monoxide dehydrogenase subunit G [Acidobacteriia bacterium]|nr:carbon monoxide dehydrogenase subunit G [Terriglobia bacterium]
MKISGTHRLPFPPEESYAKLQDPELLAQTIPGCESLEKIGEDEYKMKMKMALAAVSGAFEGKIRIADKNPPESFRLIVEGAGKIGFVRGEGLLKFSAAGDATEVTYDGDVQVGGTIAAVGQRLIDATSKTMIRKFFEKIAG